MASKPTVFHTEASTGWGGQEIRIFTEMLGMIARGYKVMLATPPHTAIYKRAREAGIEAFPVGMGKGDLIKGSYQVARIIKRERVSIINTHSSRDSWIGSIAGRLAGVKVIRTRHISSALSKNPFTRLVYGPLCDGIITTGTFIKEQVSRDLKINPVKIYSIPTGIDVASFMGADGNKLRMELGVGPDDIIIGTAAALRSWKGHEYLIKALPLIHREFPNVKAVFAGEGPFREGIEFFVREAGVGSSVVLLGHREDVPEVIKAFDISALLSYASEGIPQFALQSMAAGKPVIGTETGGIPEVVKDGINGFIVPPKDPESIAAAVKKLLSNRALMAEMGEAGRAIASKKHTREKMLDDTEELYKRLLS